MSLQRPHVTNVNACDACGRTGSEPVIRLYQRGDIDSPSNIIYIHQTCFTKYAIEAVKLCLTERGY